MGKVRSKRERRKEVEKEGWGDKGWREKGRKDGIKRVRGVRKRGDIGVREGGDGEKGVCEREGGGRGMWDKKERGRCGMQRERGIQ